MSEKKEIENYFDKLWPICRSISGNGLRESLRIISEIIPLELHEVPTGTKVFDWEIPKEWNIQDAYIIDPSGKKICDFKKNNLHVVNYSIPVHRKIKFAELEPHLHSLPSMPEAIPYVTSYYKEDWGFCISQAEKEKLDKEGEYEVKIDSTLEAGSITYGDLVLKGETDREIIFSTYLCHPSMANNELSGPLVAAFLYRKIAEMKNRRYTYRFIFIPETIGAIAYLHKSGKHLVEKTDAGYVITCIGDRGQFTYKRSKRGNSLADKVAEHVLINSSLPHSVINFAIGGSDERQYCSPGFNLPVGSLMRTMYQRFPEYHTSLDNKSFISFDALEESVQVYFKTVKCLELNRVFERTNPYCEPQLGRRGLYGAGGPFVGRAEELTKMLHLLAWTDGGLDLIDIAGKLGKTADEFEEVIRVLSDHELISEK